VKMTSSEIEVEVYQDVDEPETEEEEIEEHDDTEQKGKEMKQKRKVLRAKITRAITRMNDSMKKKESVKRRYEKELEALRRDYDRAMDLHSELYELIPSEKTRLDKWESELSNDFYTIGEKVEDYKVESGNIVTRSQKKKSAIEVDNNDADEIQTEKSPPPSQSEKIQNSKTPAEQQSVSETEKKSDTLQSRKVVNTGVVDQWIDDLVEFEETVLPTHEGELTLIDAIYRMEANRDIPSVKLITFDGSALKYVDFIESFKIHIHDKRNLTDDMRMIQLKMHLTGEANRSIDGLGSSGVMYATALKTLKIQYGQKSVIARAFMSRLCKGEKLKPNDRQALRSLSIDVISCIATLRRINYMADVNAAETLRAIVSRLPNYLIDRWRTVATDIRDRDQNPTLQHVSEFLQRRVRADFDPDFGDMIQCNQDKRDASRPEKGGVCAATSQRTVSCYLCKENHRVADCGKFRGMSTTERLEFAKANRLCFACLVKGHPAKDCRSKQQCDVSGCTRTHHAMLHVEPQVVGGALPELDDRGSVLPVIRARFRAPNGRYKEGNILIDSGAGATLVRREFAKSLGLQGKRETLEISVVGGKRVQQRDSRKVSFYVSGMDNAEEFAVEAYELDKTVISVPPLNRKWLSSFNHLRDIEFSHKGGQIDLILGVQYTHLHADQDVREGLPFEPVAKRTRLGWVVLGPGIDELRGIPSVNFVNIDIQRMYDLECLGVQAPNCSCPKTVLTKDDRRALEIFEDTCENVDGRYVIGLPWKRDPTMLPNNKPLAEKRLRSLENSLRKDPVKADLYSQVMDDHLKRGWAEEVHDGDDDESELEYYLPHFAVYRPEKLSTPLRIVFDSACEYQGVSLNSYLLKGPSLIGDLLGVLIRFRENHIAFAGDISKMFLQICLQKKDIDVHRFLWRNMELEREPTVYRLLRVTFGDRSSPDMASFVMLKIAETNREIYPEAAEVIQRDRYVDDLIHSCDSDEEAEMKMRDLETVLNSGGFKIKEWQVSNRGLNMESKDLLKDIPCGDEPTVKTLGVVWNCHTDTIHFEIKRFSSKRFTKRTILSWISTIYDPLGLAGVVTIKARIGMQAIWKMKEYDWDVALPDEMCTTWQEMFDDLERLSEIHTTRCVKPLNATGKPELHVFADASNHAYGACAYLRWPTDELASVRLVASKSRVAPLKQLTIPRLELMGALLASRLARVIHTEMKRKPDVFFWTDAQIVLHWLNSDSTKRKAFVGVRVAEIQSEWSFDQWNHVPTKQNPADDLSRGLKVQDIGNRWFQGPDFLAQPKENWPKQEATDDVYVEEDRVSKSCFAFKPDLSVPIMDSENYSSWARLVRVTACCLRFIRNWKKRLRSKDPDGGCFLLEEITSAEVFGSKKHKECLER